MHLRTENNLILNSSLSYAHTQNVHLCYIFCWYFFEAFSAHFVRTIVIKEANQRWKSIDNDDVVDDELGEAALEQIAQMPTFPQIPN